MSDSMLSIIYLLTFRLAIIFVGLVCIILGYRLFLSLINTNKTTCINGQYKDFKFTINNAAPGTLFALFGVVLIIFMIVSNPPGTSINKQSGTAQFKGLSSKEVTTKVAIQPFPISPTISELTNDGIKYEQKGDTANAIKSYQSALNIMALPMNDLAWLYQKEGKLYKALSISELAVKLSPNKAEFLDTLSEILFKMHESTKARELLKRAAELNPNMFSDKYQSRYPNE